MVAIGSWGGRVGRKEAVLRKGERRQTHMRSFSQSTKLPSKIFPWHGPADPFNSCQTKAIQSMTNYNLRTESTTSSGEYVFTSSNYNFLTRCKTSMLTRRASAPSMVINNTFPPASAVVLLFTISCLLEYCK